MAQTSLNSTGVASSGALSLQSNGTTEAIGISTGQVATLAQNPILTSGTVNGLAFLNASKVLTTGSALTFDGTNLGVGSSSGNFRVETPSTYLGTGRIGQISSGLAGSGYPQIGYNFRSTSTTDAFTYDVADVSSVIQFGAGNFIFKNATSGSAGAAISYSEQMRLTSTGLGIGTSSPSYKLEAYLQDSSGARTTPVNVAAITAYSTSNPYNGYGAGLLFKHSNYLYPTPQVAARIRSQVNDNSASSAGGSLVFDVTATNNGSLTQAMELNYAGNLGLGVTPSAWGASSSYKAIQLGGSSYSFLAANITQYIYGNAYFDGSNNRYINSGSGACSFGVNAGNTFQWNTAPSGTAGNAISFTQAMTLDASGNLGVGTTNPTSYNAGAQIATIIKTSSNATILNCVGSNDTSNVGLYSGINAADNPAIFFQTNLRFATTTSANGVTGFNERMRIDSSGNLIQTVNTTAATLTTNQTLTFSIVNNSLLRISVRGSDGTTRTATMALT
jgi:hypothetical protein